MQVIDCIASNGPWAWVVAGLIFLALELVVPGGVLLWMGLAGVVTGLIALFQPMGWPLQWLIFGGLSLIGIVAWQGWSRRQPAQTDRPLLNRRADQLVGQEAVLEQPIEQGFGRIVLGDTVWRVTGSDLAVGHRVRIVGSEGAVLRVEALE